MGMPQQQAADLEELRIRAERPLEAVAGGKPLFLAADGRTVADPRSGLLVSRSDCLRMTEALTRHSVYTHEEQLRRGYVTMPGGHRVGVAGRAVVEKGAIRLMRDLGGFNVRIARERPGVAAGSLGKLLRPERPWLHHTLIVSPPQTGKTTFLRDLARLISYGWWPKRAVGNAVHPPYGLKVGIVDERSEIAACRDGVPTFDVGPRTDVLDACPKAEGMMMLIRSMSPDVLIADEIGRPEDAAAVEEAAHAGVAVIASAHGANLMDAARRPALRRLLEQGVFERFVLLSRSAGAPLQAAVLDRHGSRALPAATIDSGAGGTP
ncbi:stage III sporulation protein AA [Paenibacillus thermoaerophilus]|nr:stage III sporulation protein AA [Paenibacillus thermoaerophilus]